MARRYKQEVHDFIKANVEGTATRELCRLLKEATGVEMSESAMKSYKSNHNLKSGTPSGLPKGHPSKQFPREIADYIRNNYKGVGNKEMAERLNKKFGTNYTAKQLNTFYKNHGLNCGLTGRFEPGHIPANKGKHMPTRGRMAETQFKKGHTPHNKLPIGSIIKKSDGYMWKKIGEGARDWKQMHVIVWEEAHGPRPEGYLITFKDGDTTNYKLENLALVSMAESLEMTRKGLRSDNPSITETGVLVARLNCKINSKKKENQQ